jgi:hypothetical protein
MAADNNPIQRGVRFVAGEALSGAKLNRLVEAVNRPFGVAPPSQVNKVPPQNVGTPTAARLYLTDSTVALSGTPTVDGSTPVAKDLILVNFASVRDGVYQVPDSPGPWKRIAKLRTTDGTDNVPIFAFGSLVMIFDGSTAPALIAVTAQSFTPAA